MNHPRSVDASRATTAEDVLLEVGDLRVYFPVTGGILRRRTGWVHAVDGVSFAISRGETLGLVGESGSGKTTIARAIMRMIEPFGGSIRLAGTNLLSLRGGELRRWRRHFQMVFQDPYASLDPRQTVGAILSEPLLTHRLGQRDTRAARVAELLALVGLDPNFANRYPHQFSGGQRQRIGVARALAAEPDLVVCDEPISALDVSIQAQVINLLVRLKRELGVTYLFIAHDLAVVRHIADRIAVLYLGKIVEVASADDILTQPRHPYTVALLSAVPTLDPNRERGRQRIILRGELPSAVNPPSGCRFHTRCWLRERLGNPELCVTAEPKLSAESETSPRHLTACHYVSELKQTGWTIPVVGRLNSSAADRDSLTNGVDSSVYQPIQRLGESHP